VTKQEPLIQDAEYLIQEYESTYASRSKCAVCESPYLEVFNELMYRGAGGANLSNFARTKLGLEIGETTFRRHKKNHLP